MCAHLYDTNILLKTQTMLAPAGLFHMRPAKHMYVCVCVCVYVCMHAYHTNVQEGHEYTHIQSHASFAEI